MEHARSSIVLRMLGLTLVASAIAVIGGTPAKAEDIEVAPEMIAQEVRSADSGEVIKQQVADDGGDITVKDGDDLQKIIDSRKSGAVVTLGEGSFGEITVKVGNITIKGTEKSKLRKVTIKADDVSIDGVRIDGMGRAIDVLSGKNTKINGVLFTGSYSRTIVADGSDYSGFELTNCRFSRAYDSDNHNLFLNSKGGSGFTITGNQFQSVVQVRGTSSANSADDVVISGNTWQMDQSSRTDGLTMKYAKNVKILDNKAYRVIGDGSKVTPIFSLNGGIHAATINGNKIYGLGGISVWNDGRWGGNNNDTNSAITIQDNEINGEQSTYGLFISSTTGAVVRSNKFNNLGIGITVRPIAGASENGKPVVIEQSRSTAQILGNEFNETKTDIEVQKEAVVDGAKIYVDCDNKFDVARFAGDMSLIEYSCKPVSPEQPGVGGSETDQPTAEQNNGDAAESSNGTKILAPQTGLQLQHDQDSKAVTTGVASASQTDQTIASAMIALMIASAMGLILAGAKVVVESKK